MNFWLLIKYMILVVSTAAQGRACKIKLLDFQLNLSQTKIQLDGRIWSDESGQQSKVCTGIMKQLNKPCKFIKQSSFSDLLDVICMCFWALVLLLHGHICNLGSMLLTRDYCSENQALKPQFSQIFGIKTGKG